MGKELSYATEAIIDEGKQLYFFESINEMTGRRVIKAIEYSDIQQEFEGKKVYNLGFGDYDPVSDSILDDVLTENGDQYRIFSTVLNSIALFYEENPDSALFVSGSDSTYSFVEKCRNVCRRKCHSECKKRHQRIRNYCNYINKNYPELSERFEFRGGIVDWDESTTTDIVDYECGKHYEAVLVIRK
jgi:hypothetical protein